MKNSILSLGTVLNKVELNQTIGGTNRPKAVAIELPKPRPIDTSIFDNL